MRRFFMHRTSIFRPAVAGIATIFALAGTLVTVRSADAQRTMSIEQTALKWDRTCEAWDALVAGNLADVTGHRVVCWDVTLGALAVSDGNNPPAWTSVATLGAVSLDTAHAVGGTITVTAAESGIVINDSTTGITQMLDINSSGIVPGALSKTLVDIADSAAHTTSGVVTLLNLNFSGTVPGGTPRGAVITMPAAANNALLVPVGSVTLTSGNATLTAGNLTVTAGNELITAGNFTMSDGLVSVTDLVDEDVVMIVGNAATTNQVVTARGEGITTGDVLLLQLDNAVMAAGGNAIRVRDVNGAGADVLTVKDNGATTIAGTAAATALTVTAGHVLVSQGNVTMTTGNFVHTAGNHTISAGVLDITPAATNTSALTMTGAGVRTANLFTATTADAWTTNQFQWTSAGAWTANLLDVDAAGAWTGNVIDITSGVGVNTGNFVDLNVGAALYTGDAINVGLGATSTAGQALVITAGGAARTTDLIQVTDAGTNVGDVMSMTLASANASAVGVTVAGSVAGTFAGVGLNIVLDAALAATTARAIILNRGGVAYSEDILTITADGVATAPTADAIDVVVGGAGAGTATNSALHAEVSATLWQGDLIDLATNATCTACQAVVAAGGAAARTTDLVALTDAGTSTGDTLSIAASSTQSGDLVNLSFGAGAATGDAVDIAMGAANVAGRAVTVASAATAANTPGIVLNLAHTGALASAAGTSSVARVTSTGAWDADATNPTYALDVDQNTGAGAVGDYALHITATGANVEALHVDNGTSKFDEAVTIGGPAGTPVVGIGLSLFPAPASQAVYIDANTAGNRPTHANGVVNTVITSATANVRGLNTAFTIAADVDANIGNYVTMTSAGGLGVAAGRLVHANYAHLVGAAGDVAAALMNGYTAYADKGAGAATTAAFAANGALTTSFDYVILAADVALNITDIRMDGGAGVAAAWNAGNTLGAGNAAAAVVIRAGENDQGPGATTGGNGGALTLEGGDGMGDGTVARNGGNTVLRGGDGLGASPLVPTAGTLNLRAGDNPGDAAGGAATLRAGDSAGAIGGNGGLMTIRAGDSVAGTGGGIAIRSGDGVVADGGVQLAVGTGNDDIRLDPATNEGPLVRGVARAKRSIIIALSEGARDDGAGAPTVLNDTAEHAGGGLTGTRQYRFLNVPDAAGTDFYFQVPLPDDWDDTGAQQIELIISYVLNGVGAAAQTVAWGVAGEGVGHSEVYEGAGAPALTMVNDVLGAADADNDLLIHRIVWDGVGGNPATPALDADDILSLRLYRDGVGDTYNGAAQIVGLKLIYRTDRL